VLRRPFLQVDGADDPEIVFAPGLVHESLGVTMGWFQAGDIRQSETTSDEMGSWIGHANRINGMEFNSIVRAKLNELGWESETEMFLTNVFGRSHDEKFGDLKRFGDIDVLAWRPDSGRVLVIECKDVQYRKTLGEVAEQLADFRGELRPNGEPDLLKKHLDRLEVLTANADAVARRLKLVPLIQLEGHLIFKNPVPMKFAWDHLANRIRLSIFSELERL